MDAKKLLKNIHVVSLHGDVPGDISGIAYDSRKVHNNYLFVAMPGEKEDGIKYEQEAVRNGAVAIVAKTYNPSMDGVVQIIVDNPRSALSLLSKEFYNNPGADLFVVGITGTNGKTTTTYLVESILASAKRKPMVIGTINYRFMNKKVKAVNTTPESLDLHMMMSEYLFQGATDAVLFFSGHSNKQIIIVHLP